jgi:hypothetical protein
VNNFKMPDEPPIESPLGLELIQLVKKRLRRGMVAHDAISLTTKRYFR